MSPSPAAFETLSDSPPTLSPPAHGVVISAASTVICYLGEFDDLS